MGSLAGKLLRDELPQCLPRGAACTRLPAPACPAVLYRGSTPAPEYPSSLGVFRGFGCPAGFSHGSSLREWQAATRVVKNPNTSLGSAAIATREEQVSRRMDEIKALLENKP